MRFTTANITRIYGYYYMVIIEDSNQLTVDCGFKETPLFVITVQRQPTISLPIHGQLKVTKHKEQQQV